MLDASGIIHVKGDRFLVAEDERDVLRFFNLNTHSLTFTANGDTVDLGRNESDFESILHKSRSAFPEEVLENALLIIEQLIDFKGKIDDVRFYDFALVPQQVAKLAADRTDQIVPESTNVGELWQVCVTPTDGKNDGLTYCTDEFEITPFTVSCINPETIEGTITIDSEKDMCPGTYNVDLPSDSHAKFKLETGGSLNCNGSTIISNGLGVFAHSAD